MGEFIRKRLSKRENFRGRRRSRYERFVKSGIDEPGMTHLAGQLETVK